MAERAAPGFLDGLADQESVASGLEIVPAQPVAFVEPRRVLSREEAEQQRLRSVEDRILAKAMSIAEGAMAAAEIDDGCHETPAEWVTDLGKAGADRMFRIAKDARQNPKEHAVYLDMAKALMVGIIKARSTEKGQHHTLNVAVQVSVSKRTYDIIDVEEVK